MVIRGLELGSWVGWVVTEGMRMEDTGNLFDYEGWGINSDEERLGKVGGEDVKVIRVVVELPDGQREEDRVFGG